MKVPSTVETSITRLKKANPNYKVAAVMAALAMFPTSSVLAGRQKGRPEFSPTRSATVIREAANCAPGQVVGLRLEGSHEVNTWEPDLLTIVATNCGRSRKNVHISESTQFDRNIWKIHDFPTGDTIKRRIKLYSPTLVPESTAIEHLTIKATNSIGKLINQEQVDLRYVPMNTPTTPGIVITGPTLVPLFTTENYNVTINPPLSYHGAIFDINSASSEQTKKLDLTEAKPWSENYTASFESDAGLSSGITASLDAPPSRNLGYSYIHLLFVNSIDLTPVQ